MGSVIGDLFNAENLCFGKRPQFRSKMKYMALVIMLFDGGMNYVVPHVLNALHNRFQFLTCLLAVEWQGS